MVAFPACHSFVFGGVIFIIWKWKGKSLWSEFPWLWVSVVGFSVPVFFHARWGCCPKQKNKRNFGLGHEKLPKKSIFLPKNISSGLISVVMTCVQILTFLGPEQGSADHGLLLCCNLHLPESEVRTQVRSLSFRKSTIAYFGKNGYPNGTKQIIKVVVKKMLRNSFHPKAWEDGVFCIFFKDKLDGGKLNHTRVTLSPRICDASLGLRFCG